MVLGDQVTTYKLSAVCMLVPLDKLADVAVVKFGWFGVCFVELGEVLLGVRNLTGLCSESESDGPHLVSVRVAPLWQPY